MIAERSFGERARGPVIGWNCDRKHDLLSAKRVQIYRSKYIKLYSHVEEHNLIFGATKK